MGWMKRRAPGRNADSIVLCVVLVTTPLSIFVVRQLELPDRLIGASEFVKVVEASGS
jgi:hypothetical protein